MTNWADAYGFARSWLIYWGPPWRRRAMKTLYGRYVKSGDLCFDVGAHVGNRVSAFRELGARVVAIEPQPLFARYLRERVADQEVEVVQAAVGAEAGTAVLYTDPTNPTVSTVSRDFQARVRDDPRWSSVRWSRRETVEVTTLPRLIDRFGLPAFCKIDVEGTELEVIRALQRPLPALSFEVMPATKDHGLAVVEHLAGLGAYRFNYSSSERMTLRFEEDRDRRDIVRLISTLTPSASSGDVYACLDSIA